MRRFILDFVFDEKTGESRIVVELQDDSMTALELNESIRGGEVREAAIKEITGIFGEEIGKSIRAGKTGLVCQDNEPPDLAPEKPGILQGGGESVRKDVKQ